MLQSDGEVAPDGGSLHSAPGRSRSAERGARRARRPLYSVINPLPSAARTSAAEEDDLALHDDGFGGSKRECGGAR